jgi:hypothetical protein
VAGQFFIMMAMSKPSSSNLLIYTLTHTHTHGHPPKYLPYHLQALGFVHVLTGPDHLSALATLSASSDCDWRASFLLGVRWGIGHSTGLLLVGSIFIIKDYISSRDGGDDQDGIDVPDSVGHFFESLVGIFMLALGVYGFRSALLKKQEEEGRFLVVNFEEEELEGGASKQLVPRDHNHHHHHHHHCDFPFGLGDLSSSPERYVDDNLNGNLGSSSTTTPRKDVCDDNVRGTNEENYGSQNTLEVDSQFGDDEGGGRSCSCGETFSQLSRQFSIKTLALLAGIIHGLAGPGGVLGVIPAVQLHDWRLATCYLGSFCCSSTITMGLFAASYGHITTRLAEKTNFEFQIHCFSSILSILVGILWLLLLSLGRLDDVFP